MNIFYSYRNDIKSQVFNNEAALGQKIPFYNNPKKKQKEDGKKVKEEKFYPNVK